MPDAPGAFGKADHTSPEDSPHHLALRAVARKVGQSEDVLRNILWQTNASDHLPGLRRIARNLLSANLGDLRSHLAAAESESPFLGWEPVLRWISKELPTEICPAESRPSNPNRGNAFLRNPLWSALWVRVDDAKLATKYRSLQRHFVRAHASFLFFESQEDTRLGRLAYERHGGQGMWDVFPESPYQAALRLRSLANPKWAPILNQVRGDLPPSEFVEAIGLIVFPGADDLSLSATWLEYRGVIRSFLARAYGLEPWSPRVSEERNSISPRVVGSVATVDVGPGDPDDPETSNWPSGRLVTFTASLASEVIEGTLESDLDPEEITDHEELYLAAPTRTDLQQIAIDAALSVRGQYRHVQMRHQLFPFDYDVPAAYEMRSLLKKLDQTWQELGNENQWDGEKRRIAETIALIQIQVWYGLPLTRALGLVVIGRNNVGESWKSVVPVGTLAYLVEDAEWMIPVDPPPYRSVIEDPAEQAHPLQPWLPLQDVAEVGRLIGVLLRSAGGQISPSFSEAAFHPQAVFQANLVETYERSIRDLLREMEPTGRVTIRRTAAVLYIRLVALSGDLMAGALITGRFGPLTRTERFYASYSVERLRHLYYRTSSRMFSQLTGQQAPSEKPLKVPSFWQGFVGARLCAKDDEVKRAIVGIGDAIDAAQGKKKERAEYHNLLTLHSVLLFCFCTSCRPIRAPYLWLDRVDEDTEFAYLSDKDDDAQHKTRLIWVPGLCLMQMKNYERHCARLEAENPAIQNWPDPCFFLSTSNQPAKLRERALEAVRPTTLAKHLKPFLQLPMNFHRKYMRHRLLEAGCPPEVVMAWLGHAFAGEELWNPHSAMSPRVYRESLAKYLLPILEDDLEWKVR